eukprot:gene11768-12840_t
MNEEERIPRSSSLSHDVAPRYTSSSTSSSSLLLSNPQPIDGSDEQQYQHFTGGGRGGGDDGLTMMMMMDDNRDDDDDETNPNTDIDFDGEDGINGLTPEDMEDGTEPGSLGNNSSNNSLRKRRLMKKAPDAPKRFKSAYICFVTDKMDDVKKSLPADMKVTEIMKTLAYMWKNLPPLERLEYEKIAEADKSRYFEEMAHYSGPLQVPNKRQKKPPGAPKRAMSAFLSFSQQMRPQIRAMYPELKNTDISGVLAQKWHSANEDEKRPHIERELKEREKYHEDMAHWKEEETRRQVEAQEKKRLNARNTIDFLDLPSSSIWESLETDIISENGGNGTASEKEMNAFWEDAVTITKNGSGGGGGGNGAPLTSSSSSKTPNKHHQHTSSKSSTSLPKGSLKTSSESEGVQGGGGSGGRSKNSQMTSGPPLQQMYHVPSSSGAGGGGGTSNSSSNGGGGGGGSRDNSSNNNNNYHENRFYAVPFPMSAMPEGQIPYAAFNLSYPEYAIPPGYFAADSSGGYGRYPYPMHPYYATRMTGEKEQSVRYPFPYPPHPAAFPPPPEHASEGYWQWRKFPIPQNAPQMSKGDKGGAQGVSPYFYDLNYLQMMSGKSGGNDTSEGGGGGNGHSSSHNNSHGQPSSNGNNTSSQPKKKKKPNKPPSTSSTSNPSPHLITVSGHPLIAPPPPYLPPSHSSPKTMTSATPSNNSQSGSNDKYNPLSTVADTLRAVQRSGLSGHPD